MFIPRCTRTYVCCILQETASKFRNGWAGKQGPMFIVPALFSYLPSLSTRRPIVSSKKQGFVTLIKRILILLSLKKLTKIAHLRRGELHTNQLRNALCTEFWIMFKFTSFWNYNFLDFWNDKKMCNHFKKGYKIWAKRGVLQNVRCLLESISQQGN